MKIIYVDLSDAEELGGLDDARDFEAKVRGYDWSWPKSHFHSLEGASNMGLDKHLYIHCREFVLFTVVVAEVHALKLKEEVRALASSMIKRHARTRLPRDLTFFVSLIF